MKAKLFVVVAALVSLAACGDVVKPAAATVNGKKIPISKVSNALDKFDDTAQFDQLAQQSDPQAVKRQFQQGYLSQLIQTEIFRIEARKLGIEVTDEEVTARIEEFKQQFPSEEAFENALSQQGFTMVQLRQAVSDQLLGNKIRAKVTEGIGASEQQLRRYYETHLEKYRQTHAQHILVDKKPLAQKIAKQLQSAPKARVAKLFGSLANKYSKDTSNKTKGGDLGWTSPGQFVPEFESAMNELEVGQVSDPVKTQFGYHVIRVIDRRATPFSQVESGIQTELSGGRVDAAWQRWLVAAYKRAEIKVNPRYGELDIETQQIIEPSPASVPGVDAPDVEATEPAPSPTS